jgi:hypothetical protein
LPKPVEAPARLIFLKGQHILRLLAQLAARHIAALDEQAEHRIRRLDLALIFLALAYDHRLAPLDRALVGNRDQAPAARRASASSQAVAKSGYFFFIRRALTSDMPHTRHASSIHPEKREHIEKALQSLLVPAVVPGAIARHHRIEIHPDRAAGNLAAPRLGPGGKFARTACDSAPLPLLLGAIMLIAIVEDGEIAGRAEAERLQLGSGPIKFLVADRGDNRPTTSSARSLPVR